MHMGWDRAEAGTEAETETELGAVVVVGVGVYIFSRGMLGKVDYRGIRGRLVWAPSDQVAVFLFGVDDTRFVVRCILHVSFWVRSDAVAMGGWISCRDLYGSVMATKRLTTGCATSRTDN